MRLSLLIVIATLLTGCGGGGTSTAPVTPASYTVRGDITGLEASGLTLTNGSDTVHPAAGSLSFSFAQQLSKDAPYSVNIATQPLGFQLCHLTGPASGTIASMEIVAITVNCASALGLVSTIAGTDGTIGGFVDPLTTSAFSNPYHVAVDAEGTIYVADNSNSSIRKIRDGIVTTLAGNGVNGNADGTGTKARFGSPIGIAVDNAGNLFVTDGSNRNIRKIAPDGIVTTVASSGFTSPDGIAVDKAGNLFVADYYDNRIRKVTPAGEVSTFAGSGNMGEVDGQGDAASFSNPAGICIDAAGNLYVSDSAGNRIRKITPTGAVSTLAGSGVFGGNTDGPKASATFNQPIGITVDNAGFVYVAEMGNNLVRRVSPSGQVTTLAGGGVGFKTDGLGNVASFASLKGISTDNHGNLIVADGTRIRKLTPALAP